MSAKQKPPTLAETLVELDGVTQTVKEWCVERGLTIKTVARRRLRFKPWKEALQPVIHWKENSYRKIHQSGYTDAAIRSKGSNMNQTNS